MRLLCATDLSSRSDRALRRAGVLARESGAELCLLSVVDDDQPVHLVESERREVALLLAEQSRSMQELQHLQPRLRVEAGDPFDVVIRIAEQEQADLVLMGEHRRRLLRDMFAGTTIERVMRRGRRPVLMVNRPAEQPYRRIVAAIDLSPASAETLRTAARLGFLGGGGFCVFHAFQHPGKGSLFLANLPARTMEGHLAATMATTQQDVTRFVEAIDLGPSRPAPSIILEEGAPGEALRRVVERLRRIW
jgi:nucleotide-binding universal stress UspA family protein